MISRRLFLATPAFFWTARAATVQPLGIAKDSLPLHAFKDTIEMLDHCHSLGAAGLQSTLSSLDPDYLKRLRIRAPTLQQCPTKDR